MIRLAAELALLEVSASRVLSYHCDTRLRRQKKREMTCSLSFKGAELPLRPAIRDASPALLPLVSALSVLSYHCDKGRNVGGRCFRNCLSFKGAELPLRPWYSSPFLFFLNQSQLQGC